MEVTEKILVRRLGNVAYAESLEAMRAFTRGRDEATPDELWLLEHPPVYTLGQGAPARAVPGDIPVLRSDRGGDVTYHGPGQLVGYPIMKLGMVSETDGRLPRADYVGFVRRLEETLVRALLPFGLVAGQVAGLTGVWIQPDMASRCVHCPPAARKAPSKIAAIGVKVDARGISQHGFALNVDPDMSYWEGIVGCGLRDNVSISLADLLPEPPELAAVADAVVAAFGRVFERGMKEVISN